MSHLVVLGVGGRDGGLPSGVQYDFDPHFANSAQVDHDRGPSLTHGQVGSTTGIDTNDAASYGTPQSWLFSGDDRIQHSSSLLGTL